jgi:outer membrane protein TolC
MKMPALLLTVLAAALLLAPASPQDRGNLSPKEQIEESTRKVKELQKERIATLTDLVDMASRQFQNGRGSIEDVLEAQMTLLKARLDIAEKESDRITLYKNVVEVLKGYEKLAAARVEIARGTFVEVLKVKARRLAAEIYLEQAKVKEAKETK